MSIIQSGMVKVASTTTAMELIIPANRSALVTDIRYFIDGAQAEDISLSVDQKKILQFVAPSTWQLLARGIAGTLSSIFERFRELNMFAGVPLGPGQKLSMDPAGSGNYMEIEFDYADVGDFLPSMINGSESKMYQLFQVISNNAIMTAAGDHELNQSDLDSVFPQFPGGSVVPAKTRMHLRGLFGGPCGVGKASETTQNTTRLKMLRDREDILSHDLLGSLFMGDATVASDTVSYLSYGSSVQIPVAGQPAIVKVFDPPVIFEAGSELNTFVTLAETATGGDVAVGECKLGMLFDVERIDS